MKTLLSRQLAAARARGIDPDSLVAVQITRRFKTASTTRRSLALRRDIEAFLAGTQDWFTLMHGTDASLWDYFRRAAINHLKIIPTP